MRCSTLCYCIQNQRVLLGMKKRGFGAGKLNGYGGKVQSDETVEQATIRELFEEAGLICGVEDLTKVASIDFFFSDVPTKDNWDQTVHVFLIKKWNGEPVETDEMSPKWYDIKNLPLDKMWVDDPYWLPQVFDGKKIKASFVFGEKGKTVLKHSIDIVKSFE